jgi:molecular chaperone HscC
MFLKHHSLTASQLEEKDYAMLKKQAEVAKREFSEKKVAKISCLINDKELELEFPLMNIEAATQNTFFKGSESLLKGH